MFSGFQKERCGVGDFLWKPILIKVDADAGDGVFDVVAKKRVYRQIAR